MHDQTINNSVVSLQSALNYFRQAWEDAIGRIEELEDDKIVLEAQIDLLEEEVEVLKKLVHPFCEKCKIGEVD